MLCKIILFFSFFNLQNIYSFFCFISDLNYKGGKFIIYKTSTFYEFKGVRLREEVNYYYRIYYDNND